MENLQVPNLEDLDEWATSNDFPFIEVRDKIIERGICSVNEKETGPQREGGLEGFEICGGLNSLEEFAEIINSRSFAERQIVCSEEDEDRDEYWRHRYATLQIEFAYEALKISDPQLLQGSSISVRSIQLLADIMRELAEEALVGMKEENKRLRGQIDTMESELSELEEV